MIKIWENPFMVVYESYSGDNNNTINSVTGDSDGETSVLSVESDQGKQTIIQSFSKKAYQDDEEFFSGHFGVISYNNDGLSYLYMGEGLKLSAGKYSLETAGKKHISANMEIREDKIIVSSNQDVNVYLPFRNDGKVIVDVGGERTEMMVEKSKNDLWMIKLPAIMNAFIYK